MDKNSLYASAAYPVLPTACGKAETTDPAAAALVDVQLQLQALRDWVNKRLAVVTAGKFLYRTSEAKAALGVGTSKLYDLINNGTLDARRFGHRTYITADSLEAFVAALPPAMTPTRAKIEHDRWSGHGQPTANLEDDEAE